MPDILHRIQINAPAERVYEALTTEEGLSGWWTRRATAADKIGEVSHFQFEDKGFNRMKVAELKPSSRVKWECVDGAREWIGTTVSFDLRTELGGTVVMFRHCGWAEPVEFMHYCSTKWAVFLLSLKRLCETGQGLPYPDDIDIG